MAFPTCHLFKNLAVRLEGQGGSYAPPRMDFPSFGPARCPLLELGVPIRRLPGKHIRYGAAIVIFPQLEGHRQRGL